VSEIPSAPTSSTQIAGQQATPTTTVPHTPQLANSVTSHNLAQISLITGILSYFGHVIPLVGGSTLAIVAIVTGYMARNQIKETGEQGGTTMATVGMLLGIVNLALVGIIVILLIFFIFVLGIGIFGIAARNG
jgi:uncharacterized protein with PQ loop repeat